MIQAINTQTVTAALVQLIGNDQTILDIGNVRVESNEPINKDPAKTPWVGIYQVAHRFNPRALGFGTGFRMQQLELAIILSESSMKSGADCEARMEKLISSVVGAILSDPSIGGTMTMTADQFQITYSDYRNEGGAFFKEAVIQFTVESPVTVT